MSNAREDSTYDILRDLVHAHGIGLLRLRKGGVVDEADAAACLVFGREPEELVGREIVGLLAEDSPKLEALVARGEEAGFAVWCEAASGSIVEVRILEVYPSADGTMVLGVERASQSATLLGTDLLSLVAHEMRTPLTGILGVAELFEHGLLGELNADQLEHLGLLRSCGDSLLRVINDMLDVARIIRGKMEVSVSTFSVPRLIDDAMRPLQTLFASAGLSAGVELETGVPEAVRGDADKLTQVLINLLGNALKFTEKGGVTVRVRRVERPEAAPAVSWWDSEAHAELIALRFEIHDTGMGISKHDLESIFKPYVRVPGVSSRQIRGSGLGLAYCKEVITLLGGHIAAESTPGKGSVFAFEVPLVAVDEAPERVVQARVEAPRARRKGRILVIEDDDASCRYMVRILQSEGHTVMHTRDSVEGVQLAYMLRPDLVLLDYFMPRLNGHQALMRLRDYESLREVPVIAVTSLTVSGAREQLLEQGFDDFIPKPFNMGVLVEAVQRQLREEP